LITPCETQDMFLILQGVLTIKGEE
jgi:hypothetical protein